MEKLNELTFFNRLASEFSDFLPECSNFDYDKVMESAMYSLNSAIKKYEANLPVDQTVSEFIPEMKKHLELC